MTPNISIVTCFYDIGRSKWEGFISGHPLPSYLKRTTDEYFERFERLLKLENDIVVFTSKDLLERFKPYQEKKPNLCVIGISDFEQLTPNLLDKITKIQNDPKFFQWIKQPFLPEYWNPKYVLINYLKSWFVNHAIDLGIVLTDTVAWVDFGYAREDNQVPTNSWSYNFDPSKIHLFSVKKFVPIHMNLKEIIRTNDVFIQGCHVVASTDMWPVLWEDMQKSFGQLVDQDWIDDDQTMMYMSYCRDPLDYEIHYLDESKGWFQIMKEFNNVSIS